MPHNRDPSGAASDNLRGLVHRLPHNAAEDSPSRGLQDRNLHHLHCVLLFQNIFSLGRLTQCFSLLGFHFHPNGPDEPQEFASYCRDHLSCVFAARGELSIAAV